MTSASWISEVPVNRQSPQEQPPEPRLERLRELMVAVRAIVREDPHVICGCCLQAAQGADLSGRVEPHLPVDESIFYDGTARQEDEGENGREQG